MLTCLKYLLGFTAFCAIASFGSNPALAQDSIAAFQNILRQGAAFDETDFAAAEHGQTVVRIQSVKDKREVAVSGLISLQVAADVFLKSFRETLAQRNNPAILEIGSFSAQPTLDDLATLTFEERDLEDLKECVTGNCKLKLSVKMIERLQKEVDWETPDYSIQATQLLKLMFLDYVRDYMRRGDAALIEYRDKPEAVRLVDEYRALMAAPSYLNDVLPEFSRHLMGSGKSPMRVVEDTIVWSKIKFGLKPVIAINHIMVYRREQETGPQVVVISKQIYANHYFDASLALTAFVSTADASNGSYLIYENRSRADGLGGMFSKMKRAVVEDKAVDSLKHILESSRANLMAQTPGQIESAPPVGIERSSGREWKIRRVHVYLLLSLITTLAALLTLRSYNWKGILSSGTSH